LKVAKEAEVRSWSWQWH